MHILTDGRLELPDDAAQLQDHCSVEIPGLYHGQFKEQTQNKYTEGVWLAYSLATLSMWWCFWV